MSQKVHTASTILAMVILAFSVVTLLMFIPQHAFYSLITLYGISFIAYLFIYTTYSKERSFLSLSHLIWLAVGLRVILIFIFPQLSDDIYRFIWDGNLIHSGINPYSALPSDILHQDIEGNSEALYALLNSPDYYTVYPPIAQIVYYLGSMGSESWELSAIIMKVINNGCDIASIFIILSLLRKLRLPENRVLLYALNPLVLVELCGNLHMEAIMLFFFLGFLYFVVQGKKTLAVAGFGLSIATKLLPILFIPFMWKYFGKTIKPILLLGGFLLILFLPILLGIEWINFATSLDLYFGKFEFNGGIYTLLRYFGKILTGHNLIRYIGPGMALITLTYLYHLWKQQREWDINQLIEVCFFIICCHYFLSTTVHPWYLSFPLALSLFTRYRFVVLWTGLIMLSYINYSYPIYQENLFVMAIEYVGVFGFLIYEIKKGD